MNTKKTSQPVSVAEPYNIYNIDGNINVFLEIMLLRF